MKIDQIDTLLVRRIPLRVSGPLNTIVNP